MKVDLQDFTYLFLGTLCCFLVVSFAALSVSIEYMLHAGVIMSFFLNSGSVRTWDSNARG